jgi:branched-chain amino acid transport system permease protein
VPDTTAVLASETTAAPFAGGPPLRFLVVLALAVGTVLAAPLALDTYTVNILVRAFFVATVAVTVDVCWGYGGHLTFGQSAFFGIGAYALAIVFGQYGFSGATIALSFALAVGVAGAVALFVGWLSFYPGSTPLYASVISLVLPIVVVQLIYSGGTFTGSSSGLVGFESFDFELETWFRLAGLFLVAVAAAARVLMASDAGRLVAALRDNEMRATYLGIDASRLHILILVVGAAVSAMAGWGYAAFGGIAAPENAGFTFGTQLVVMVALGGRGTVVGAVLGALAIEVASAWLSGTLPYVWALLVGLAFVVVVVALPGGLLGALAELVPASRRVRAVHLATAPAARSIDDAAIDAPVVEIHDVGRCFGSLTVLSGIDLVVRRGELVSLVGPNGAGKTTLVRCLADGRERTAGRIRVAGHDIGRAPPERIVGFGLGRKFQAASVFETLSVADCLRVARFRRSRLSLVGRSPLLALPSAARAVVEISGLADRLHEEARLLSHGLKQALELAMVLALEPEVILLDEPTAGLTRAERSTFGELLIDLVARDRLCVLIIEHDLDFVCEISSRIVVLHQGRIALDGTVDEVVNAPLVREIYSGRPVETATSQPEAIR